MSSWEARESDDPWNDRLVETYNSGEESVWESVSAGAVWGTSS